MINDLRKSFVRRATCRRFGCPVSGVNSLPVRIVNLLWWSLQLFVYLLGSCSMHAYTLTPTYGKIYFNRSAHVLLFTIYESPCNLYLVYVRCTMYVVRNRHQMLFHKCHSVVFHFVKFNAKNRKCCMLYAYMRIIKMFRLWH